jgi:hypothetical protein
VQVKGEKAGKLTGIKWIFEVTFCFSLRQNKQL